MIVSRQALTSYLAASIDLKRKGVVERKTLTFTVMPVIPGPQVEDLHFWSMVRINTGLQFRKNMVC